MRIVLFLLQVADEMETEDERTVILAIHFLGTPLGLAGNTDCPDHGTFHQVGDIRVMPVYVCAVCESPASALPVSSFRQVEFLPIRRVLHHRPEAHQ